MLVWPSQIPTLSNGLSTSTFSHDQNGNVTQKTTDGVVTTYVWDYANRLVALGNRHHRTASHGYVESHIAPLRAISERSIWREACPFTEDCLAECEEQTGFCLGGITHDPPACCSLVPSKGQQ